MGSLAMASKPKKIRLKIERHIAPSVFNSIGLLLAIASTVELVLANVLLRLIGSKRGGVFHAYPLVTGMDFKVKISLIRIYTKMYGLSDTVKINKTLDRMNSHFGLRNLIAHSAMFPGAKRDSVKLQDLRAKVRLGKPPQAQSQTAASIRDAAVELHGLVDILNQQITDSGVLTSQEYGLIDQLNHQLESQKVHIRAEPKDQPTSDKPHPSRDDQ